MPHNGRRSRVARVENYGMSFRDADGVRHVETYLSLGSVRLLRKTRNVPARFDILKQPQAVEEHV